jgi:protein-S-isoprenylcysteine O-methyltransferase Ste14
MSLPLAQPSVATRLFAIVGGLLFAVSLVYFGVSFADRFGEYAGAWSIRAGWLPAFINFELFTTFATHHSVFARTGLKTWIERVAPRALERSIYVWVASLLLLATCWFWQPVPGLLWHLDGVWQGLAWTAQAGGVALSLVSAARLDNLSLAGVRQVFGAGRPAGPVHVIETGPFGWVRHPIYLGWFLMVWPTPVMTGTRLTFAAYSCLYLVLAIPLEERDLARKFGQEYEEYAKKVRWRVLPFLY